MGMKLMEVVVGAKGSHGGDGAGDMGTVPAEAQGLLELFPCPPVQGDGGGSPPSRGCSETGSDPSCLPTLGCP